jgi:hypothetical protein
MAKKKTEIQPTFEVDKAGLAKLLERKGKEFAVGELVQNAWDENITRVEVKLEHTGAGFYTLEVTDDSPEGFADIAHAYTLFADSKKKDDPEKRGRFNLGEKLVIAMCDEAMITTTKGTIYFDARGRRFSEAIKTEFGSTFVGELKLTETEAAAIERLMYRLIPPTGIETVYNGKTIPQRESRYSFQIALRTERADADGYLRPTTRKTWVQVFEPTGDEKGMLYELGIPVVETGDSYHVNIGQKVPLNTDRDNVPPSYLRDVRRAVLNAIHEQIDKEVATEKWVDDALEHKLIAPEAVQSVVTARYGEKAVTADPSDPEAEKIAVSQGYTLIPGGAFSRGAWRSVRSSLAVLPAGQVTPSPKPDAGEDVLNTWDEAEWPTVVKQFAQYVKELGGYVLGDVDEIIVKVVRPKRGEWPFRATWKKHPRNPELTLNWTLLGYPFFEKAMDPAPTSPTVSREAHELLIHELAHQDADEHLSEAFYDACCKYGARIAEALAGQPNLKQLVAESVGVPA